MKHSCSCSRPESRVHLDAAAWIATVALVLIASTGCPARSGATSSTPATSVSATPHRSTVSTRRTKSARRRHRAHTAISARANQAQGFRAAIDPATGALVNPTPAQARALTAESAARAPHGPAPLQVERLADGTLKVALGDRFMNYAVARVDSAGALHYEERVMRDSVSR